MNFIDVHTHNQQKEEGVIKIQNIYPGEGFAAFAGDNYYSVGLHPWHIKSPQENDAKLESLEKALAFDHVIAIGECGLDKRADTNFEEQIRTFSCQIDLSEKYKKPLIIHNVKATDELILLKKGKNASQSWIVHGFNGTVETALQLIDKGFLFSFGGRLFLENSKAISSFSSLPLECLFLETDEQEGSVERIYERGAALKNIGIHELKKQIEQNFKQVFGVE